MVTKTKKMAKLKIKPIAYDKEMMKAAIRLRKLLSETDINIKDEWQSAALANYTLANSAIRSVQSYLPHIKRLPNVRMIIDRLNRGISLINSTISYVNMFSSLKKEIGIMSLKDIYTELLSIKCRYKDVTFKNNTLSLTTTNVTLQDIDLGRFQISIKFSHIKEGDLNQIIKAVALEPNPASSDSSTTHPHVQDDLICYGNIHSLVKQSLHCGNIENAVDLINELLHSYNDESPYVSLEDWEGVKCSNCGDSTSQEDYCRGCDNTLCGDCLNCCDNCGRGFCSECINNCHNCDNYICENCESGCECGNSFCSSCLNECSGCSRSSCTNCLCICSSCERAFCEECTHCCVSCGTTECGDCISRCSKCDEDYCLECIKECENCNKQFCKDCDSVHECSLLKDLK